MSLSEKRRGNPVTPWIEQSHLLPLPKSTDDHHHRWNFFFVDACLYQWPPSSPCPPYFSVSAIILPTYQNNKNFLNIHWPEHRAYYVVTLNHTSSEGNVLALVIVISCFFLVPLSMVVTERIPFVSISNLTSIWETPCGDGRIPFNQKLPRDLLSHTNSLPPQRTLISIIVWPPVVVEKTFDLEVDICLFYWKSKLHLHIVAPHVTFRS